MNTLIFSEECIAVGSAKRYVVVFSVVGDKMMQINKFITGQNEREESTQNTTVTNSAAYASYTYWRMQNNCTTSDRFKRFFFSVAGYYLQ